MHAAGCPSPVVISVPHAGRYFPQSILNAARVSRDALERLGDGWCDLLAQGAGAAGAAMILANHARAVADCNRAEGDMAPGEVAPEIRDRFSAPGRKERAGLGVVPTRLAPFGPLWRMMPGLAEMEGRLNSLHRPYHAAIVTALDLARRRHGWALLVDLHSMPPIPAGQRGHGTQLVIGDNFGSSCAPIFSELALDQARMTGIAAGRNQPYAGGHIIRRHGNPGRHIHAIQIEIDRRLYLDDAGEPVTAHVARWSQWLAGLITAAADIGRPDWLAAAE